MSAVFDFQPTPDQLAGLQAVTDAVNAPTVAENIRRAAEDPPLDPLPLLSIVDYWKARVMEIANSYEHELVGGPIRVKLHDKVERTRTPDLTALAQSMGVNLQNQAVTGGDK